MRDASSLAVVDAGRALIAHARVDNAWLGSIDIAINKAWTARAFDNAFEGRDFRRRGGERRQCGTRRGGRARRSRQLRRFAWLVRCHRESAHGRLGYAGAFLAARIAQTNELRHLFLEDALLEKLVVCGCDHVGMLDRRLLAFLRSVQLNLSDLPLLARVGKFPQ